MRKRIVAAWLSAHTTLEKGSKVTGAHLCDAFNAWRDAELDASAATVTRAVRRVYGSSVYIGPIRHEGVLVRGFSGLAIVTRTPPPLFPALVPARVLLLRIADHDTLARAALDILPYDPLAAAELAYEVYDELPEGRMAAKQIKEVMIWTQD